MAEQVANLAPASAPNPVLVAARAAALGFYSPTHFLRELPAAIQQVQYGTGAAARFGSSAGEQVLAMTAAEGQWLLQHLPWDTEFFGTDTYRLFTGLFGVKTNPAALALAAGSLRAQLAQWGPYYAFSVVPAEDVVLLQALTGSGWRLVETRLNFYCPVAAATLPAPAPVRLARPDEAAAIGRIAAAARNDYDRFHADPWFGPERADAFLARYAEAAVAGTYADAVLLPDEPGLSVDAFLAIGDAPAEAGVPGSGFSRVLLTAVGPQNRGWHFKLVAETVRRAVALSLPYVLMTTQATNKAVFRTCEKLGFRLGSTTHLLACSG
jgi:dTDP-4-amino-4,6-dideoxy-D-galactose acyltransferase